MRERKIKITIEDMSPENGGYEYWNATIEQGDWREEVTGKSIAMLCMKISSTLNRKGD